LDHKFSLIACARWEEADALEWLDYHRSIGIDHVYLYSNDDDPDTLRDAIEPHLLGTRPFVTYRHWEPGKGSQAHMYSHFLSHHRSETEWLCFLDIDEFLVIKPHNDLPRFMAPLEIHFDAVYFNWIVYGACGRATRQPGSVLRCLTRRNRRVDPHTKNFIRATFADPDKVWPKVAAGALAFWHFWEDYEFDTLRVCDVLGEPVERYTENWPQRADALINRPGFQERARATAYVAHFQFKSEADFLRRAMRGGNASQQTWRKVLEEGRHLQILAANDAVEDTYLSDYWKLHAPAMREQCDDQPQGVAMSEANDRSPIYDLWNAGLKGHNATREARVTSAIKCLKLIRNLVSFDNVVDFGCGIGAWLHAAKLLGAGNILGFEGEWIRENDIIIDQQHIRIADLSTEELDLKKGFDLAMAIEVGEHLPETAAEGFCRSLTSASDHILFSAAIPGQGGLGHVNEQWLPYWVEKFWKLGYVPLEPIRPYIADDRSIQPWLRQNLVMFVRYDVMIRSEALLRFARPLGDFRLHYRFK